MGEIPRNEAHRLTGNGNLKEGLLARVRQRVGKRRRSYNVATVFNMLQESNNLVYVETEPGTAQDFVVFG